MTYGQSINQAFPPQIHVGKMEFAGRKVVTSDRYEANKMRYHAFNLRRKTILKEKLIGNTLMFAVYEF